MLDQMIYLIYWYGSKNDGDFYGFVSKSNFFTYEQESAKGAKGIHVLPAKLQEKMNDTRSKLTSIEEDTIRTYQEVEEDLLKDPPDRKRGVLSFLEGYEMLSYDDLDEIDVDDSSSSSSSSDSDNDSNKDDKDDDDGEKDEPSESKKPKPINKKSNKLDIAPSKKGKEKQDKKTVLEDIDSKPKKSNKSDVDATDAADPSGGKVSSKSSSINKKRSRISLDAEDSLITTTTKKKKKPKKDPVSTDSKKPSPSPLALISDSTAAVLSDGIGENDEDDDDDINDKSGDDESSAEMEHDDDVADEDDDKDDLDFIENVVGSQKPIKTKHAKLKKVTVVKKEQKVKTKIDLPKTDKQLKRKETEEFRMCEEQYSRLISKWETAIKTENMKRLRQTLLEADIAVGNFCSSFMLSYDLSTIIKNTKVVLKKANEDLSNFIALKEKFKRTFETKRLLVPKGYVPPKRSFPPPVISESNKSNESSNMDVSDHGKMNPKEYLKNLSHSASSSTVKGPPSTGIGTSNTLGVARPTALISANAGPRPKFSLGSMLQQQQHQQQRLPSSQSSSNLPDETKVTGLTNKVEQVPSWATASVINADEIPPIPQDDDTRSLALEFLLQMAQQFPEGLVNVDAMARSMEHAIYHWAQNNCNKSAIVSTASDVDRNDLSWVNVYWRKVHAIVAAFGGCGNIEKGTFYTLLLQGKLDTPNTVVTASDDKYVAAFEGKAVLI